MPDNFTHLHLHTCWSELDGLGKIPEYLAKARDLGMKAMAVTDHGTTSGVYELVKEAPKYGIKPLLGTEFYISTSSGIGHLVAIAETNEGWSNILKMQHYAYTDGFYKKPCIDFKVLERYKKGIIFTSACVANPIGHHLVNGEYSKAYEFAYEFASILGSKFYIELQSSESPQQAQANRGLVSIAEKLGLELVLTNDCHYVNQEDWEAHDVLLCMQTKKKFADEKRFRFEYNTYHMKDINEIQKDVYVEQKYIDRALENTNLIADMCNATIEFGGKKLPDFPNVPKGMTEDSLLAQKTMHGYKKRLEGTEYYNEKFEKDLENELSVISRNGYSGYHLIVADYVNYARNNGIIVGDGRGSGAGCKVAYCIGITNINPDKYHLLFERFLADGREPDYLNSRVA